MKNVLLNNSRLPLAAGLIVAFAAGLGTAPATAEDLAIRGRIEAEDGQALDEISIQLFPLTSAHERGLAMLDGGAGLEPQATAKVSADGFFELSAPLGMWTLKVEADGYVPMEAHVAPLLEDKTLPDLELQPAREVAVQVLGPDGSPADGALVRASPDVTRAAFRFRSMGSWTAASRHAVTGADGKATLLREDDEKIVVSAFAAGFVEAESEETKVSEVVLRLGAGKALDLKVTDDRGGALADVLVRVGKGLWPAGTTDESGLLTVDAEAAGKLRLALSDSQGRTASEAVQAAPADSVAVVLPEPLRLSGRVVDAESRMPVAGALLWRADDQAGYELSDGRGGFSLASGVEGAFAVQAAAAGYFTENSPFSEGAPLETTFALRPAAAVRGMVVDAAGAAVAQAEIGAQEIRSGNMMMFRFGDLGAPPRARSGKDGRFHLTGLDPKKAYTLTASKEGYAGGEAKVDELQSLGTVRGLRIVLDTGDSAYGHVFSSSGAPVAGARVELREGGPAGPMGRIRALLGQAGEAEEAYSDNDGRFEFANLGAGSYEIEVTAEGFAPAIVPGLVVAEGAGGADLGTVTLEPGAAIEGRVVDTDGKALEGADVRALESNPMNQIRARFGGFEEAADAVTAPDGFFSIGDRRPDSKVDLVVQRSGYSAKTLSGVEVPPIEPVEIALQAASSLAGKIVDPGGEPVVGAQVNAIVEGGGSAAGGMVMMMAAPAGIAVADSFGEFKIEGLDPGTVRLRIEAAGFRRMELGNVEIPAGEDVEGLEIEIQPGASVSGRVVASDGTPAVGANVMVSEGQRRRMRFGGGAQTDGDGRYFLNGVEPGIRLIEASHDELGSVARELTVEDGENSLDLAFEGGVEVVGRVVDEGGSPVAGATVSLAASARTFGGNLSDRTGSDGGFRFEGVRDGNYFITASAENLAASETEQTVEVAGSAVYGVEVRLVTAGVITGRIVGVDPADFQAVQIFAFSRPGRFAQGSVSHDGTYRIESVGAGEWNVNASVESGGQAEGRVTVEPGAPETLLDLEFGGGIRVTGVVLRGDEPLTGIHVSLQGLDVNSRSQGTTDRSGRFSLEGLKAGKHSLRVMDFTSGLNHTEEHEIGGERDLVVDIAITRLSGHVIEAGSSMPVIGATVRLEPISDGSERDPLQSYFNRGGSTDSEGYFSIHDVAAGSYRMIAEKDGYTAATRDVTIEPDRRLEGLELVLQPTDGLTLRVRLPSGSPASHVTVAVVPPGGGQPVAEGDYRAGQEGLVRISTVPAGNWEVLVASSGTAVTRFQTTAPAVSVPVSLQQAANFDVVIQELAEDPSVLKLQAIGDDGRPAPTLSGFRSIGSEWRMTFGRARVEQLPPGNWLLRATASDGRSWEKRVSVAPGANARITIP